MTPHRAFTAKLILLAKIYRLHINKVMDSEGLAHTTALIMLQLARGDGRYTQKDLAKQVDIAPASLVPLLQQIEDAGLIERRSDQKDRRANHVVLTAKGKKLADTTEKILDKVRKRLFRNVAADDVKACLRIFEQLESELH